MRLLLKLLTNDHIVVEDGHPGEGGANDFGEVERLKIRDS